ncbi:hypothetical protein HG531_002496 [Fusarium graminearum]|nr:hypothetical protein HG531_002496 [Fusarium graminearum]
MTLNSITTGHSFGGSEELWPFKKEALLSCLAKSVMGAWKMIEGPRRSIKPLGIGVEFWHAIFSKETVLAPAVNNGFPCACSNNELSCAGCHVHASDLDIFISIECSGNIDLELGSILDFVGMSRIPDPDGAIGMGSLDDCSFFKSLSRSRCFGASLEKRFTLVTLLEHGQPSRTF